MTRYTASGQTSAFNYSSTRIRMQVHAPDGGYVARVMAQIALEDSRKNKSS